MFAKVMLSPLRAVIDFTSAFVSNIKSVGASIQNFFQGRQRSPGLPPSLSLLSPRPEAATFQEPEKALELANGALVIEGDIAEHIIPRGDNLFEVRDATLKKDGQQFNVERARMSLGAEGRILSAVLVDSDGKTWIMDHRGEMIGLDVLTRRITQTKDFAEKNRAKLSSLESRLSGLNDGFSTKLNESISRHGSRSFFQDVLSVDQGDSVNGLFSNLREKLQGQKENFSLIDTLLRQGDFDLALVARKETQGDQRQLEKALSTIESGIGNLEIKMKKFAVAFETLNAIAGNLTPSGKVRVKDQPLVGKAYGDMLHTAKTIIRSGLVGDPTATQLYEILVSGMGIARKDVDIDLAAKQARGDFSVAAQPAGKSSITDWLTSPKQMLFNKVMSLTGFEAKHPTAAKAASLLMSMTLTSPTDMGDQIKTLTDLASETKASDRVLLAAVEYGEFLDDEAARDDATLYTKVAQALNPVRFMKETYHTMEVNYGDGFTYVRGFGYFVSGQALTVLDVLMPQILIAKGLGAVVGHDVDVAAKSFGWSVDTKSEVKTYAAGITTALTLASGDFKYSPTKMEFLGKAVAFFLINKGVSYSTGYYMDKLGIGGKDKEQDKQQMEFVVNSILGFVGGKAISLAKNREAAKMLNEARALEMKDKVADLQQQKAALLKQEKMYENQLANAELKLEAIKVGAEVEALQQIQANNAPGGQSGARSLRPDTRAGGQLDKAANQRLLLEEAKRTGSEVRGTREGEHEFIRRAEKGKQEFITRAESRVGATREKITGVRAEIQRLDRTMGRADQVGRGSARKALTSQIVEGVLKSLGVATGAGGEESLSITRDLNVAKSLRPQIYNRVKPLLEKARELVSNERGAVLVGPLPTNPTKQASGGKDWVVENIAENRAARKASKIEPYFKAETIAKRQVVAHDFYRAAGWSDSRIANHIQGIDFNQPVDVVFVKKGTILIQHGFPGDPVGGYFAEPGVPAKGLGVYPRGRIENVYEAQTDFYALRSIASHVTDRWSVKGWDIEVPGGQRQYFIPDSKNMKKLR